MTFAEDARQGGIARHFFTSGGPCVSCVSPACVPNRSRTAAKRTTSRQHGVACRVPSTLARRRLPRRAFSRQRNSVAGSRPRGGYSRSGGGKAPMSRHLHRHGRRPLLGKMPPDGSIADRRSVKALANLSFVCIARLSATPFGRFPPPPNCCPPFPSALHRPLCVLARAA